MPKALAIFGQEGKGISQEELAPRDGFEPST